MQIALIDYGYGNIHHIMLSLHNFQRKNIILRIKTGGILFLSGL